MPVVTGEFRFSLKQHELHPCISSNYKVRSASGMLEAE
jgi:hypothetical protein